MLRENPTVEQAHYKLWLTSKAVLSKVLHNDVFVQTMLAEEQIRRRLGLYVQTGSFEKARRMLETERVCILAGVPGVGKTTLAEMLVIEHLMNGWNAIDIRQNVGEGQRLFDPDDDARQVFYYDDFLGQISTGEKLGKNEDRVLLHLMAAVSRRASKRFILTTREYILAQAKAEHEHLARSNIDLYRFVVSCDDYSDLDKARILANHLFFNQVPQEHIGALVAGRVYMKIISHRNYSPRIIEWMTQAMQTASCRGADYPELFLARLDNPSEIWSHAFENQINEPSRHLLLVLATCGDGILMSDLRETFNSFYSARAKMYGFPNSPLSFDKSLNELEGSFIRIDRSEKQLVISCHNPSILDFLSKRFELNPLDANDILRHALFFEQIERLFKVFNTGKIARSINHRRGLDLGIVREAIERTLLARCIGMVKSRELAAKWGRAWWSVWDRLATCCRIGTELGDEPLRELIRNIINDNLKELVPEPGQLADLMPLLDRIAMCDWIDPALVDRWNRGMWDQLFSPEGDIEESLEGLSMTAKWFASNRQHFQPQQARDFEERLALAVSEEIEHNSRDNDSDQLEAAVATLLELSETLVRDFTNEINRLNEKLGDIKTRNNSDYEAWKDRRPEDSSVSIHSIFESLL